MQEFDVAIVVTIEANTYDGALRIANNIAEGLEIDGETAEAITNYDHDNDGQRVLYLHPENQVIGA